MKGSERHQEPKRQQGATKPKCKESRNSRMQKTRNGETFFPGKHLSIQVHQGSGLVAMIGAQVPALVRNFTPHSSQSYPGSPRCYTLQPLYESPSISPLLATGESIRANFAPSKQDLEIKICSRSWDHCFCPFLRPGFNCCD